MIKGVFFDIGGVLLGSANTEIRAVLAGWIGRDPLSLRQIFAQEYPLVERGRMSERELQHLIQTQLQIPAPAPVAELAEAWKRASLPVPGMFDLARSLKEHGYLIGLLSNTQTSHVEMMREMGFAKMFDTVIFSCEVDGRKPEPEIYRLAAAEMGIAPEEALFIDDLAANVAGAQAVGMRAIHHQDVETTVSQVYQALGISTRSTEQASGT